MHAMLRAHSRTPRLSLWLRLFPNNLGAQYALLIKKLMIHHSRPWAF